MQVLCIRENPKWKNIHSGRIYTSFSSGENFLIKGNKVGDKEIFKYFKIL